MPHYLSAPFLERELDCDALGIVSRIAIGPKGQERLHSSHAWLNDDAVNCVSQLIHLRIMEQSYFLDTAYDCSVFSTHMVPLASRNVDDFTLWQNCRYTRFWNRPVWIIPVHLPDALHWRLAVVAHDTHCIFMYDSQGIDTKATGWAKDLRVCCHCSFYFPLC